MSKKKKIIIILISLIIIISAVLLGVWFSNNNKNNTQETSVEENNTQISKLKELPKPEITGGSRGELGIDKNINEQTIDEYLNREDAVYRDMRMLEDPSNYEAIGGDRFLSGYIDGFEVIPLPYIIPVTGLPKEVGDTYTGTTLFYNDNGTYIANYKESMDIIEQVFPKDKVIFLMCGGGGYAGMTKNFLVSLGWDENKIYNVGGYWYYKGEHSVTVKKEVNGEVSYDFDSVPYYKIEFDKLTKSDNYKEPEVKVTELKINTSKIELEEGASFKLNVIVLPNEATNKEVKWTSGDEKVATVTQDGLVNAIGAGNTTITVQSVEGEKTISCEVSVKKKEVSTRIKVDDVSKEAKEMNANELNKLSEEFSKIEYDSDGNPNPKYYDIGEDGSATVNDLWRKEYDKYQKKNDKAKKNRIKIVNKLLDNKKSFILLIHYKECEERDYKVIDGAEKVLKKNNYSYISVGSSTYDGDEVIENSKLDESKLNGGSVAIIKDGEIYATINPDVDSIKNEKELKNWLSKYIDIK